MGDAASQMAQEQAFAGGTVGNICLPGVPAPVPTGALASGGTVPAPCQPGLGGDGASNQLCEPHLLSQLVQLLGQRPRHSLLLSDLGALLPGHLRHGVKERGGLRSWLQKYPQLFQVSGYPGKESVTLLLGAKVDRAVIAAHGAANPPKQGAGVAGVPVAEVGAGRDASSVGAIAAEKVRREEEDEENESAIQMRGLPYRATVADVKKFLGVHAQSLKDDYSIQLVANRDGRPSGFARVQFDSPAAAKSARDGLHMQMMELAGGGSGGAGASGAACSGVQERYVELFLYSERPNKLRIKKLATGSGCGEEEAVEASKVSKEQVVVECREHMMSPGKGHLLLSMLGVALSESARLYLKRTDQGLKQFLAQYPKEFIVDGVKGRECVSYLPALAKGSHNNSDLPTGFPDSQRKNTRRAGEGTGGPASGSINDLQRFPRREEPTLIPQSPKVTEKIEVDTPKELGATPSDWGTPHPDPFSCPGYDPTRSSVPQTSIIANMGPRNGPCPPQVDGVASGPAPDCGAGSCGGAQSLDGWAAWALPPPGYWPDPASWASNGSAPLPPWGTAEGQTAAPLANTGLSMILGPLPTSMTTGLSTLGSGTGFVAPKHSAQDSSTPAVHLRGLPFASTEQDILAFFAKHEVVDRVSEAPNAVKILRKANGKHTGQAVVEMMSRTDAHVTLRVLNGQYMDTRYIEVSHHTEGASSAVQPSYEGQAGTNPATAGTIPTAGMAGGPALLQPVGVVSAGSCQLALHPPESQSLFDGAGDTGGSGSMAGGGGLVPAFAAQHMWWGVTGPALEGPAASEAKPTIGQVTEPCLQGYSGLYGMDMLAAGTGDGTRLGEEEQERWKALFNFLKRDTVEPPPIPSPAALSGLGSPDAGLIPQSGTPVEAM